MRDGPPAAPEFEGDGSERTGEFVFRASEDIDFKSKKVTFTNLPIEMQEAVLATEPHSGLRHV